MDNKRTLRILFLVGLVILVFLTAAVPAPASTSLAAVSEKSDLIALTVQNKSSGTAYVWLDGPAFYYLVIKPEETKTFTVLRGEYFQDVRYCGASDSTIVDLTRQTKLVMPVCGANTRELPSSPHLVDITNTLKIVKVTLTNDASSRVLAILTGPSTYVFLLDKDESKDFTIAKGDYEVAYYACGAYGVKEWSAYYQGVLKFKCP